MNKTSAGSINSRDGSENELSTGRNDVERLNAEEVIESHQPERQQSLKRQKHSQLGQHEQQIDSSNSTTNTGASRISAYNKNEILKRLMTNGCSAWNTAEAISRFKVDPESVLAYFNQHASQAQAHVGEECSSLSFENINDWLVFFKDVGLHEVCDYETALVLKAIALNENHISPSELGGIDLRSIYKFLGNALMGLPQTELNPESAKFLSQEFENLINDVNTNQAGSEAKHIKDILNKDVKDLDKSTLRAKLSMDPLGIDDDIKKYL